MKIFNCRQLILLFLLMVAAGQLHAADNPPADLLDDLVKVEDSNFIIDKHLSCDLSLPRSLGGGTPFNTFTVHLHFNAPATGLISRDKFVALAMRLFTEAKIRLASEIPGLTTEQTIAAMQCHEVSATENEIKYEYLVTMSHDGVTSKIQTKHQGIEKIINESWQAILRSQHSTD